MMRWIAILIAVLLTSRCASAATQDCDPLVTPSTSARMGLPIPGVNQCTWDVPLNSFLTGVDTRAGVLDTNGTWTGIQTFNAGRFLDKGSLVFDVKAFGAAGDGVADDTTAVTNAKVAAEAVKGILFFSAGTYKLSASLTFTDLTIVGAGKGASIITATSAVAGSPLLIIKNSINNGAIRTSGLRDLAIRCNAATPALGNHPTNLIDGVRVDNPIKAEHLDISNCDKGFTVNTTVGFIALESTEIHGNFYGVYDAIDSGGNYFYNNVINGNTFANFGIASTNVMDAGYFLDNHMGFAPYGFFQEGDSTTTFMTGCTLRQTHFETIGNAALFSKNFDDGGNGGAFQGNTIEDPGFSSADTVYRLLTASCTANNTPWPCCTGSGAGCSKEYAVQVGLVGNTDYYRASKAGFVTPIGGTSAFYINQLASGFFVETPSSTNPTFTIPAGFPGWLHVIGFNGQMYSGGIVSFASAATLNVDNAPPRVIDVTGTTGITALSTTATKKGQVVTLHFTGALTLTNSTGLKLAGATNFTTSADDVLTFYFDGTNWIETSRSDK